MNPSRRGRDDAPRSHHEVDVSPESAVGPDEDELVDEMVDESFPGSDPPATWAGADQPPPGSP